MISPEDLMRLAITTCRQGIASGQSPFGCAIAIGDRVIANAHNTVLSGTDITAHAEMNAVREANLAVASIFLEGAVVATTCEPCPMCMAALHWARVAEVYYGASIADADSAGFNELKVPAAEVLRQGGSRVKLAGGVLSDECRSLFGEWLAHPGRQAY
ncbi:MAG: nucleoside deaminase [Pirellulales bacterium]|nr:nucleoside deaminase [Pirellulales bacterium]